MLRHHPPRLVRCSTHGCSFARLWYMCSLALHDYNTRSAANFKNRHRCLLSRFYGTLCLFLLSLYALSVLRLHQSLSPYLPFFTPLLIFPPPLSLPFFSLPFSLSTFSPAPRFLPFLLLTSPSLYSVSHSFHPFSISQFACPFLSSFNLPILPSSLISLSFPISFSSFHHFFPLDLLYMTTLIYLTTMSMNVLQQPSYEPVNICNQSHLCLRWDLTFNTKEWYKSVDKLLYYVNEQVMSSVLCIIFPGSPDQSFFLFSD